MMHLSSVRFLNGGYCWQAEYFTGKKSFRLVRFHAVFVHLKHPRHGEAVIDTGYSPLFIEATRPFPQRLYRWITPVGKKQKIDSDTLYRQQGINPRQIRTVFVSHFHADHIAGLNCFPAAQYVWRNDAYQWLSQLSRGQQLRNAFLETLIPADFQERGHPIDITDFSPGHGCLDGFRVCDFWGDSSLLLVDLPGHAIGQMGFLLNLKDQQLFYLTDACWNVDLLLRGKKLPWIAQRFQHSEHDYYNTQLQIRRAHDRHSLQLLACHCPSTQRFVVP